MSAMNTVIFDIYDQWFWKLPDNLFEKAEFWYTVGLTVVLCLFTKERPHFSLICSF